MKWAATILLLAALMLGCADEDDIPWSAPDVGADLDLGPPDTRPRKCGDGIAEEKEKCDGNDLRGNDCTTVGYFKGTLACSNVCTFDFSGCSDCGNGKLDKDENCDGKLLGGHTCKSLGYKSGTLSCKECHLIMDKCVK